MLYQSNNFDEFVKKARSVGISSDLTALLTLDIIFYEEYEDYLIISLPDFEAQPNKILVLSEQHNLVYPEVVNTRHPLFSAKPEKGESSEATIASYLVLRKVLSNYTAYYERLKAKINAASDSLDIEKIEDIDKKLKKFWDVIQDFESLFIALGEKNHAKFVDPESVGYDYDLLRAKATHLSDNVRGARNEIHTLRSKCEVQYSKALSKSIERLTYIMAYLTIVSVIVTVPNTVATIYGIAPFAMGTEPIIIAAALLISTVLTIVISYYYIKKWKI